MLPKINEVEIDKNAVVPCPSVGFKSRRAHKSCPSCADFKGLCRTMAEGETVVTCRSTGDKRQATWSDKFAIRCAHVIERKTQIIEVIEE